MKSKLFPQVNTKKIFAQITALVQKAATVLAQLLKRRKTNTSEPRSPSTKFRKRLNTIKTDD